MKKITGLFMALPILLLVLTSSPVLAQEEAEAPLVAEGELLRVDPDTQTIAIQTADGVDVEFRYTEATEIIGAEGGVEGLAGKAGTQVRVHYSMTETAYQAERIEVLG